MVNVNDFDRQLECDYKDEHYLVRDNGSVYRLPKGKRFRPSDNKWTFGNVNLKNGYMYFGNELVHRIVATAFIGKAPSCQHVVDHIDINKQNNRPDNLRWLTKIENILNNETSRKKVELICGSVEAFRKDPTLLFGRKTENQNNSWMKTVTPDEAKNSLENWEYWAKTVKPNPNYKNEGRKIGDWIFESLKDKRPNQVTNAIEDPLMNYENEENNETAFIIDYLSDSLTPSAKQRDWKIPTRFSCCPAEVTDKGLVLYKDNLKEGELFSSNNYDNYYVIDKAINPQNNKLIVLSRNNGEENSYGTYSLCSVEVENGKYIHESLRRFGDRDLATRFFNLFSDKKDWTEDDDSIWDT